MAIVGLGHPLHSEKPCQRAISEPVLHRGYWTLHFRVGACPDSVWVQSTGQQQSRGYAWA
jgi:hypothetical protein